MPVEHIPHNPPTPDTWYEFKYEQLHVTAVRDGWVYFTLWWKQPDTDTSDVGTIKRCTMEHWYRLLEIYGETEE